jgi:uncharacterized protein
MAFRLAQILMVILCATTFAAAAPPDSRLSDAAMNGDHAAFQSLLKERADVNGAQGDGSTALHWAAFRDDLEMARSLIKAGASINPKTRLGEMTPLFMAAKNGNAEMIELLLKAGAGANSSSSTGTTPLMLAAAAGSPAAVRVLLDYGANANAKDVHQGQTALMFAAGYGRAEAVKVLASRGADLNAVSLVPTRLQPEGARGQGNAQAAQAGRRGGRGNAPLALGGLTALQFAARDGHRATVEALVESGADVNVVAASDKMTTLTMSILNGQFDIAKYLVEHGADPRPASTDGVTALYATVDAQWAIRSWYPAPTVENEKVTHIELMKALLDHGADVNARMGGRLWMRIRGSGPEINGATAFWRAAMSNDLPAMKFLVSRGANPNLPTVKGVTPVTVAAGVGHSHQAANFAPDARLATVKYLVEELGADVRSKDDTGLTALHGAALVGDNDLILYLVAQGGDVKARTNTVGARIDGDGDTAVAAGTGETVADMANGPRETALVFPETVALLEKLGSENSNNCRASTCIQKPRTDKKPQ